MEWLLFAMVVSQPVELLPADQPRVIWVWGAAEPSYLDPELFEEPAP